MPKKINLTIKESVDELRKSIGRTQNLKEKSKLKALLLVQSGEVSYQTELESRLKYTSKTIHVWLKTYELEGLASLISVKSGGNRKSIVDVSAHEALLRQLDDPSTKMTSYVELLNWYQEHYNPEMKYSSLYSYCRRKLRSKLKVARKSHIKKDPKAEEVFKKATSVI